MPTAAEPGSVRSVLESHGKLNRPCLVALGIDRAERGRAPVRVRIAEQCAVEQVTDVHLEAQFLRIAKTEFLEEVHVLTVVVETPYRSVVARRVAKLERSGIRPGIPVEVVIL